MITLDKYPLRLCVFGSRGWNEVHLLFQECDKRVGMYPPNQVLHIGGGANGADTMGEQWAARRYYDSLVVRPTWKLHAADTVNRAAGYERNIQMARTCTEAIGFWDGHSPGTEHMFKYLVNKLLKPTVMIRKLLQGSVNDKNDTNDTNDNYIRIGNITYVREYYNMDNHYN